MRAIVIALSALLVIVLIAASIGVGVVGWVTMRAFPQTNGTLRLPGLAAPVWVVRDANGIVQIAADTPADLFRAQGYVHASERLWQMELWRHISSGRLSELFGASQLDTDRLIRTLGWRQAAQRDLDAASSETKAALDAYAAGVNAYIDAHRGSLGMPFVVAGALAGLGGGLGGYTPEPWTPLDSVAWSKVQAWNLGGDYDAELFRLLAVRQGLDPALLPALFPPYPNNAPVIVPTGAPGSGGAGAGAGAIVPGTVGVVAATTPPTAGTAGAPAASATAASATSATAAEVAGLRTLASIGASIPAIAGFAPPSRLAGQAGVGSNDWVVGPSRSATGHALLANDPHLGNAAPSVWFVNGLHCRVVSAACPFDVSGVTFPGVPGVVLGHNARIAWGATNVNPDAEDLFRETVDPTNPAKYLTPTGPQPFATRTETIRVAGGPDVTLTVRETRHGPILNDAVADLKGVPDLYALEWTATDRVDGILDTFLALDRAASWDDFRKAFATYGAPSQNFVYADVDGHIGYQMPGAVPIRRSIDPNGLPADGASGAGDWIGTVKYDDLPRLFDPPGGIIVTANNAVVDSRYPFFIGRAWDPGYRAGRIAELLGKAADGGGVTAAEIATIQNDTFDTRARDVIPYLRVVRPTTQDGWTVLQRIAEWDGRCTTDSLGCSAYETFELALLRYVFDDDLGALAKDYVGTDASRSALRQLLAQPSHPLWDRRETVGIQEGRDTILTAAIDQAGRLLRRELGGPNGWTWGRLHTISWDEPAFGSSGIGPLAWYFNVGPFPAPGTADAVDNTGYDVGVAYPDPTDPKSVGGSLVDVFRTSVAPSMRHVIDMGDLDGARIVHAPGQSGVPFARHYGDLATAWLAGRSIPLPFSAPAIDRSAIERLTLTP